MEIETYICPTLQGGGKNCHTFVAMKRESTWNPYSVFPSQMYVNAVQWCGENARWFPNTVVRILMYVYLHIYRLLLSEKIRKKKCKQEFLRNLFKSHVRISQNRTQNIFSSFHCYTLSVRIVSFFFLSFLSPSLMFPSLSALLTPNVISR